MNNKYLIAIDLDGTLLHDDKLITAKTRDYLSGLARDGHCIVIATGRPLRSVLYFQQELNIDCPVVCYNGTMSIDYHHQRFPKRIIKFNRDIVHKIINDVGLENFDNIMVETEKCIYLLKKDDELNEFFWNEGHNLVYGHQFDFDDDPMTLIFKPINNGEEIKEKLKSAVSKYPHFNLRFWYDSFYSEVYLDYGTKKDGLAYIASQLNIDQANTIACGDNDNDIEMLGWATHSVVMENASDDVKSYATIITKEDNNNDGLVEALKEIIG